MSSSSAALTFCQYGRQGVGVAQPQSGSDYPLVGPPSADIRYLLADLWLAYDDPFDYGESAQPFQLPFRIWWLHGVGTTLAARRAYTPTPAHAVDVMIVDARNCVVFDSTQAGDFTDSAWGDRLRVCTWQSAAGYLSLAYHTCWGETAAPGVVPTEYADNIYPTSAVLDERTTMRAPRRVRALRVGLDRFTDTAVEFHEGYNVTIGSSAATRGSRQGARLRFSATPGAGLGVYPECDPPPLYIRRINGVAPDESGAFFLAAHDCFFVRQPSTLATTTSTTTAAMLKVGNDCEPCCSCEDYVATAEYMNQVRDRFAATGQLLAGVRDMYHVNRQRWCELRCCFESKPLRLVLQPQLCPYLDIAAQYCNSSDKCVGPVTLTVRFDDLAAALSSASASCDGAVEPIGVEQPGFTSAKGLTHRSGRNSGAVERYTLGGEWPEFSAHFDAVEAYQSVWVKFRLKFTCCGVDTDGAPLTPKATLTGTVAGEPIQAPICDDNVGVTCESSLAAAASVTASAALRCPPAADQFFNYSDCQL